MYPLGLNRESLQTFGNSVGRRMSGDTEDKSISPADMCLPHRSVPDNTFELTQQQQSHGLNSHVCSASVNESEFPRCRLLTSMSRFLSA